MESLFLELITPLFDFWLPADELVADLVESGLAAFRLGAALALAVAVGFFFGPI